MKLEKVFWFARENKKAVTLREATANSGGLFTCFTRRNVRVFRASYSLLSAEVFNFSRCSFKIALRLNFILFPSSANTFTKI